MIIIPIIALCLCLSGASWMLALGLGILITYIEDRMKERRKNERYKHNKRSNVEKEPTT